MTKEILGGNEILGGFNYEKLGSNLIATRNYGKNVDTQLYLTGIPEGENRLTDKEGMELVFGQKNKAVAQVFFDGLALGKEKRQVLRDNTKKAIHLAGGKLTVVAYSSGILNLMDYSEEEIEKIDKLILVNPMMGRGSLNGKYALFGFMFPSKEEVFDKTAVTFERLTRKDAIMTVLSKKDDFMNNKVIKSLLENRIDSKRIYSRQGGHAITQTELLSIVNGRF